MRCPQTLFAFVLLWPLGAARADGPLHLSEVLESLDRTHPKVFSARAKVDEAEGKTLSARGAFEPAIEGEAFANPTGYYEHNLASLGIEQRVPRTGVTLKGKYRLSQGELAPYYGERRTRSGGEFSARVIVPLVRNFLTDPERTAILKAESETSLARAGRDLVLLALVRDASVAYFEWAARGQLLEVARELVEIAERREETIEEQADRGAIARIDKTDARRVVLARQDRLLKARAAFVKAQQTLSLYYRSSSLEPIVASSSRVPERMPALEPIRQGAKMRLVEAALARRPELTALEQERKLARADLQLAQNDRLPRLDLGVYAARDLGAGDPSLGQTDLGIGVALKIPVLQRKGRGKAAAARARLAALDARARALRDRISAEIQQAMATSALRAEQAELARQRWSAARLLARAERERLSQGFSDILRVNLREKDVAAAASDAIEAELEKNKTLAELYFVAGRKPRQSARRR